MAVDVQSLNWGEIWAELKEPWNKEDQDPLHYLCIQETYRDLVSKGLHVQNRFLTRESHTY